jgi:PAS domain S-box-containing protein
MRSPFFISILFILFSLIWIYSGDQLLLLLPDHFIPREIDTFQRIKEGVFVMATAVFIFIALHKQSGSFKKKTKGYRPLFEENPNPMWIYDVETLRILDVNKAAILKYGYSREEFLELRLPDLRPRDGIDQLYNYLTPLSGKQDELRVVRHRKKNGDLFYVQLQSTPTTFQGHQTRLIQALDVHEKILAEQKRKKAIKELANFRRAVSKSSIICAIDSSGNILSANENLCNLSQYKEEDLIGQHYRILLHEQQDFEDFNQFQRSLEAGEDWRGEFRCRAKDGSSYWVAANIIPVPGENKTISHYLSISHNISEKKQSEEKIKEALVRYDTLAKATYDTVWEWDLQDNSLSRADINPEDDLPSKQHSRSIIDWWARKVHPDDYERVVQGLQQTIEEGETQWEEEYRFLSDNKNYRYVIDRGFVIYNQDLNPVRVIGAMQDIHKLRESQKEIKKLSLVAEKTQNAVIITDKEGRIEWVNDGFTHLCQYSLEEVAGKKPGSFLQGPLSDPMTIKSIRAKLRHKKEFTAELINYRKDGSIYWNRMAISPILDENGSLTQYISIQSDITERKKFIERLEQQNKQLKKIAWISSHEVRRPVASILGLISLYDYANPHAPFNQEILQHLNTVARELDMVIHRIVDKTFELEEK